MVAVRAFDDEAYCPRNDMAEVIEGGKPKRLGRKVARRTMRMW